MPLPYSHRLSHRFTPIPEGSETEDESSERRRPTPLHPVKKQRHPVLAVTCDNCRPSPRTKSTSSVAPVASPNFTVLKSIISSLSRRSPKPDSENRIVRDFNHAVSAARGAVKSLAKALMYQIRQPGVKVLDRVFGTRLAQSEPLILHLEGVLNSALFQDFESAGFARGSMDRVLNPINRCGLNYAAYNELKNLTWEEVLSKGTRHFSEEFSRFCDRKMSEIVGVLGWNRAWPEPLLRAFFGASKGVWLVHLLANSVHPGLGVFRAETGLEFDSVYMESAERGVESDVVRVMVAPGFYVYDGVIKCKVLCKNSSNSVNNLGGNCGSGTYER